MNSIPSSSSFENSIIAYEPVWAIGTGLTPTIDEIDDIVFRVEYPILRGFGFLQLFF